MVDTKQFHSAAKRSVCLCFLELMTPTKIFQRSEVEPMSFSLTLVETTFLTVPASELCEQDPCRVSMCLKLPMTKCLTSALCKPVYFDGTGNVLNCTGKIKK